MSWIRSRRSSRSRGVIRRINRAGAGVRAGAEEEQDQKQELEP
jgi:hypothetical protein